MGVWSVMVGVWRVIERSKIVRAGFSRTEIDYIKQELEKAHGVLPEELTFEQREICYPYTPMATPLPVVPPDMPGYVICVDRQKIIVRSQEQVRNLYRLLIGKEHTTLEDAIRAMVRKVKLEKTIVEVLIEGDVVVQIPGLAYKGLAIHPMVTGHGIVEGGGWVVTHLQSGLRLVKVWLTKAEAKVVLVRLIGLADWTQPKEYFQGEVSKYLVACVRLMAAKGVYAPFPEDNHGEV